MKKGMLTVLRANWLGQVVIIGVGWGDWMENDLKKI